MALISILAHSLRDLLSLFSNITITKTKETIPCSSNNHPKKEIITQIVYVEGIIATRGTVEEIQNLRKNR